MVLLTNAKNLGKRLKKSKISSFSVVYQTCKTTSNDSTRHDSFFFSYFIYHSFANISIDNHIFRKMLRGSRRGREEGNKIFVGCGDKKAVIFWIFKSIFKLICMRLSLSPIPVLTFSFLFFFPWIDHLIFFIWYFQNIFVTN